MTSRHISPLEAGRGLCRSHDETATHSCGDVTLAHGPSFVDSDANYDTAALAKAMVPQRPYLRGAEGLDHVKANDRTYIGTKEPPSTDGHEQTRTQCDPSIVNKPVSKPLREGLRKFPTMAGHDWSG